MKSKELAYWIGVAQTDSHFKRYFEKRRRKKILRYKLEIGVSEKSLPMLQKFVKFSKILFGEKTAIAIRRDNRGCWRYELRVKNLLPLFERWDIDFSDPPKPPIWCIEKPEFFGAYLAGVIDGDGDVRVARPQYPQCAVRITSSCRQEKLIQTIKIILSCSVNDRKRISHGRIGDRTWTGSYHILEFYVSSKNYKFIEKNVLPFIAITYKKEKIESFIKTRMEGGRRESNSRLKDFA